MSEAEDLMKCAPGVCVLSQTVAPVDVPRGTNAVWELITDRWWDTVGAAVTTANGEMIDEYGKFFWDTWSLEDAKMCADDLDDAWRNACLDALESFGDVEAE